MRVGQRVGKGQVVGLCGNSGTSSEPHLHYHLQNTPIVEDGAGIKVFFERAMLVKGRTWEARTDYSPVKGDVLLASPR